MNLSGRDEKHFDRFEVREICLNFVQFVLLNPYNYCRIWPTWSIFAQTFRCLGDFCPNVPGFFVEILGSSNPSQPQEGYSECKHS